MLENVLSWKYAGFIFSAYGVTFAVLLLMILWVIVAGRKRQKTLAVLQADGLRRASAKTSDKGAL